MDQTIYEPLEEYVNVFRDRFQAVCEETFVRLADEAGVDVESNRKTCFEIEDTQGLIAQTNRQINLWTIPCVILWIAMVGGAIWAIVSFVNGNMGLGFGVLAGCILFLWLLLARIHPKLRRLKDERDNQEAQRRQLIDRAWKQMEPLNRLYDWDIFARMMTQTIPRLEFDPFFTTQRLEDLKVIYNWDEGFNAERSVLFSHSGLINGNPFVICRTKKMEWGEKEYTGSKTIHWTETARGSDGKYHTQSRSQTLTATITRPYPEYHRKTRLIYGNTAAPDLTFTRTQNGFMATTSLGKLTRKMQLKRKARDLTRSDFAMMNNEEFEVAFDTRNRNNNQQYAMLFTALAQQSMMALLSDKETGYGDDFDFEKNRMINIIIPNHLQGEDMDMNPEQYRNFSYDRAAEDFLRINAEHFRAIYFAFAPLLCVNMYQTIRSQQDIYGRDMKRESAYWEHEALANFWGESRFSHPDCVTESILKTEKIDGADGNAQIRVKAYGFRAERRLTYVSKYGGDGRYHDIPVYWDEYIPVTGHGSFDIKEDHSSDAPSQTQGQRIARINALLSQTGHTIFRRNISSRL